MSVSGSTHNHFYQDALLLLNRDEVNYMLGGAFALFHYTGIYRDTKDLDIFCKSIDYPKILQLFAAEGYRIELTDTRWLAKVFHQEYFIDIIFDSVSGICRIDDTWQERSASGTFMDVPVRYIPAEELIWCKTFVQNRERSDAADINHVILRYGDKLNWHHLLERLNPHWHLLLAQLINFQFVYPSEYRDRIPRWLFDELIFRAQQQYEIPSPRERVCRGPLIDQTQYQIDIKQWSYKSYTIKTV